MEFPVRFNHGNKTIIPQKKSPAQRGKAMSNIRSGKGEFSHWSYLRPLSGTQRSFVPGGHLGQKKTPQGGELQKTEAGSRV